MDSFYIFYQVAMITSMVVSVGVALLLVHLRARSGAKMMTMVAAGTFLWTLGFFLESHNTTLQGQLFYTGIGYIGMLVVPPAWFIFAAQYVGDYRISNWRYTRWLFLVPLIVIVLIWTNGAHHLMWSNAHLATDGAFTVTVKDYGPFFWLTVAYDYLLILAGIFVLLRRLVNGPPLYRNQAIALVFASMLPLIGNVLFLLRIGDIPHKDLTPVAFALSGLAIALGFWRFHLFRAVPFAREIIVRRLHDGIFIFSPGGRLLDANTAALEIVGAGQGIIGSSLVELKLVSPLFEMLARGESRRQEVSFETAPGRRTFELDTVPLRDNKNRLAGWLSMLHDITERKEGERTLAAALDHERQLRISLEEEIGRRLRFSQALVHEVKTLVAEPSGGTRQARRTHHGNEDLNLRLDELLDFTRGEMGLLETAFRTIDPLKVIHDALEEPEELPPLRIHLPDSLPAVRADETRLRQVVRSLLDYAAIRTRPGDVIDVRARHEGSEVVVAVQDTGPELTPEERTHLFDPYQRAAMERLLPGGLALGLALSKMLAELHGGQLRAESGPGKGCTLIFSVPAARGA